MHGLELKKKARDITQKVDFQFHIPDAFSLQKESSKLTLFGNIFTGDHVLNEMAEETLLYASCLLLSKNLGRISLQIVDKQ